MGEGSENTQKDDSGRYGYPCDHVGTCWYTMHVSYRPVNTALRFSANALRPSDLSEVCNSVLYSFLSRSNPCSRERYGAALIAALAAFSAKGAIDQLSAEVD